MTLPARLSLKRPERALAETLTELTPSARFPLNPVVHVPTGPHPPYEEAIRPARGIPVTALVYTVTETEKMLRSTREEEQRQRAKERGCCEVMMSDVCCGELTKICCYVLCCIPYLCIQCMD